MDPRIDGIVARAKADGIGLVRFPYVAGSGTIWTSSDA